jgi:hypothetical protein
MNDALISLTAQLAATLATDEGAIVLARMQRLALAAARAPVPPRPDSGLRLGIWEPIAGGEGGLEFARAGASAEEWRYWADVDRIPHKAGTRVVLVGESVARAYLFDPELTLAGMLSAALGVEVVDLARTDLTADPLPPLFDALPVLEPDAVVLFAGNNWCGVRLELEELDVLANALRSGGFARSRSVFLDTIIRGRARATLDAIADRLEGVPLCLVVPEFNLRDWRSEPSVIAPILPDLGRWLQLRTEGRAEEMIALDGGTSPISQQLAAEQAIARGDTAIARQRLEAARDALCGLMTAHSPRCPAVVQDQLRSAASRHGWAVVDLPRLLGSLPDRRMFLDYCHLTGEGLCTATAAIAAAVAPALGVTPGPVPPPASHTAARAHLLAAVHNAHYGQPADVVGYHAARACELDPEIGPLAVALADAAARPGESWLCRSWASFGKEPQARRYLYAPEMLRAPRVDDTTLARALAAAAGDPGLVDRIALEQASGGAIDLLDTAHRAATFREAVGQGLGPSLGFVRATAPVSRFVVVRQRAETLDAAVTLRAAGPVRLVVNGVSVGEVGARPEWSTATFRLALDRGRNTIELHWPAPHPEVWREHERAARQLERGLYPDVLTAFGEVHAFTAHAPLTDSSTAVSPC